MKSIRIYNNYKRYLFLFTSIAIMLLIFFMSAQTAEVSTEQSGGFIEQIAGIFVNNYDDLDASRQQQIVANYQYFVRKSAHFCIYMLLSISASMFIDTFKYISNTYRKAISFLICIIYAASDEIHQFFVPGRSCQVFDILVDSMGVLCGIIILTVVFNILKKIRGN